MPKSLQELFHARSLRELFEGAPDHETTVREAATAELELRPECQRTPIEEIVVAAVPGDCDPEDAWFEQLAPTGGMIADMMEQAREGHRIAEEFPERGAYHGGPPLPDMGGVTVPADPRNLIGPFVPVPPEEVPPPMSGGFKMRIEPYDEYVARQRAMLEAEGSSPSPRMPRAVGRTIGVARGFPVIQAD